MVYEASARIKDPVNSCASEIHQLRKQIVELESQLATKEEELKHIKFQYDNHVSQLLVYPTVATSQPSEDIMYEEVDPLFSWGPLWESSLI
ncbi:hypothetical protein SUGI_0307310 [Cryptomeria japonica]|nr:hypothetical protein SUGI_0307310 [Cryptomeria japonica]